MIDCLADVVVMFDQETYSVAEGVGQFEVCLSVANLNNSRTVTLSVRSQFNSSITGIIDSVIEISSSTWEV